MSNVNLTAVVDTRNWAPKGRYGMAFLAGALLILWLASTIDIVVPAQTNDQPTEEIVAVDEIPLDESGDPTTVDCH